MDIIRWGDIAFFVSPNQIRGMKDFAISASCETGDSKMDGEKFIKKKNSGAYEVSMTAMLNAFLGENVRETVLKLTEAARLGEENYLYAADNKLLTCKLMMVSAKASNVHYAPDGTWTQADVALTLKQSTKSNGTISTRRSGKKEKEKPESNLQETMHYGEEEAEIEASRRLGTQTMYYGEQVMQQETYTGIAVGQSLVVQAGANNTTAAAQEASAGQGRLSAAPTAPMGRLNPE